MQSQANTPVIIELMDNPGVMAPLLLEAGLPDADIGEVSWMVLLGCLEAEKLVAAGGLEQCGSELLLRSVVVAPASRGKGLELMLMAELESRAANKGYESIFLLTLDAQGYFSEKSGYREIGRESAPEGIRRSSQFTGVCPASATLMVKNI